MGPALLLLWRAGLVLYLPELIVVLSQAQTKQIQSDPSSEAVLPAQRFAPVSLDQFSQAFS